jgi:hypothetical protein
MICDGIDGKDLQEVQSNERVEVLEQESLGAAIGCLHLPAGFRPAAREFDPEGSLERVVIRCNETHRVIVDYGTRSGGRRRQIVAVDPKDKDLQSYRQVNTSVL